MTTGVLPRHAQTAPWVSIRPRLPSFASTAWQATTTTTSTRPHHATATSICAPPARSRAWARQAVSTVQLALLILTLLRTRRAFRAAQELTRTARKPALLWRWLLPGQPVFVLVPRLALSAWRDGQTTTQMLPHYVFPAQLERTAQTQHCHVSPAPRAEPIQTWMRLHHVPVAILDISLGLLRPAVRFVPPAPWILTAMRRLPAIHVQLDFILLPALWPAVRAQLAKQTATPIRRLHASCAPQATSHRQSRRRACLAPQAVSMVIWMGQLRVSNVSWGSKHMKQYAAAGACQDRRMMTKIQHLSVLIARLDIIQMILQLHVFHAKLVKQTTIWRPARLVFHVKQELCPRRPPPSAMSVLKDHILISKPRTAPHVSLVLRTMTVMHRHRVSGATMVPFPSGMLCGARPVQEAHFLAKPHQVAPNVNPAQQTTTQTLPHHVLPALLERTAQTQHCHVSPAPRAEPIQTWMRPRRAKNVSQEHSCPALLQQSAQNARQAQLTLIDWLSPRASIARPASTLPLARACVLPAWRDGQTLTAIQQRSATHAELGTTLRLQPQCAPFWSASLSTFATAL